MTDVLSKPSERRISTSSYLALPLSLFRRRHSTQSNKTSAPSLNFTSNDPLSEVIDIGQSSTTSQHTNSHADEPLITSPEDEERQRLRDAAAQSIGLNLSPFGDDDPRNGGSTDSSSPSRQPSKSSKTVSPSHKSSSIQSGLLSSLQTHSPQVTLHNPFVASTKLPPYPCSYSELAPFIHISSSYLKFAAGSTNVTRTSNGLAFISLPRRTKSAKPHWKLHYVVLTVPREHGYRSPIRYSVPQQSSPSIVSDNNSLAESSSLFHTRNSPPPPFSSFIPNHSHLHLFKSRHPTRDEIEVDRLEINEDTVVYIADIELAGKKGLVKVSGRNVGPTATSSLDDEELSRTLWILKYPDFQETTHLTQNIKVVYPDESEVQQRWVKEIKSSVLSQRSERAGFLHASSQPVSPRSSLMGSPGYSSSPSNGWHLPVSPNRKLPFFPQPRPPQPVLPPPNPNPRYAEHVGAAPSSAALHTHPPSANPFSHRLHPSSGPRQFTGLRNLFQSPYAKNSHALDDDISVTPRNRVASPAPIDSGSVWSGGVTRIQSTAIEEEGDDAREMPQHQDIHPLTTDEPPEDYASFLKRLNTRLKDVLKEKKPKRRPKSAGAVSDKTSANEERTMNPAAFSELTSNQNQFVPERIPMHPHALVKRSSSPPNDMSVASIYSQSSAYTARDTRSYKHSHKRSASTGTIAASLQSQNVAEWVASTAHIQAQGETRVGKDLTEAPMDQRWLRHNDRLSIGESLVISLSLNPRPRSQRRSTTISALAASALRENWTFPPVGSSTDVSDGAGTPGRPHPYSHPSTLDAIPPVVVTAPESHSSEFDQQSPKLKPSVSPSNSVPPSTRNSIDLKPRNGFHPGPGNESKDGNLAQFHTTHDHEYGDVDASGYYPANVTSDDANVDQSEQDRSPQAARPERAFISNSVRSPFGRAVPLIYKRVSAPPATSTISTSLPPLRPPPSFTPPLPPTDLPSNRESNGSELGISLNSEFKKTTKSSSSGSTEKDPEAELSFPRPFRLSLNPSPPPTQPLPPRPDEILIDGTITFIENDKRVTGQRERPHSTLVGPRQKPYKTFTMSNNERSLFMSMYPVSVTAGIPEGGVSTKHGDPSESSTGSPVPAPQPPPQGPLPPTPKSVTAGKGGESIAGLPSIFIERSRHSPTRRLRIMSSPPPAKAGHELYDDNLNVNKFTNYRAERTEPVRSRFLIPAPPRIPPPTPKETSREQTSSMRLDDNLPLKEGSSSAEHADSSLPFTFLYMDDTPQTSIFSSADKTVDRTAPGMEETYSHGIDDPENELTPFFQDKRRSFENAHSAYGKSSFLQSSQEDILDSEKVLASDRDRNANLFHDSNNEILNDYEIYVTPPQHASQLNLADIDVVTGRITPPSPPLSITARPRADSLSNLSGYSNPQCESSTENERDEDFNY